MLNPNAPQQHRLDAGVQLADRADAKAQWKAIDEEKSDDKFREKSVQTVPAVGWQDDVESGKLGEKELNRLIE